MKTLNKYTYLFIGLLVTAVLVIFAIIPRFEKQAFDPDRVENISQGLTPTTSPLNEANTDGNETKPLAPEIIQIEKSEIEKLLLNNHAKNVIEGYKAYLLIGSDERDKNSSEARGFVEGQRADVIIIGLIDETESKHYLLSIPRDTLIVNPCTENLERINGSYSENKC